MHSEHVERAICAAALGSKVAIYADTLERAQGLAREVEDAVTIPLSRVSRLNGRHFLEFPSGGKIHFLSTLSKSTRGMSLDRVFLPVSTQGDALMEILPALATSSEGVLTGY